MGLFKSIKDMKAMTHEAPELFAQANQLSANAQAMAASQQPMAGAPLTAPAAATGPDFEPVAGVSLELYAEISRSFATVAYDQSKGPELAAARGVGAAEWQVALDGWNARIGANPGVASRFNTLYTGR